MRVFRLNYWKQRLRFWRIFFCFYACSLYHCDSCVLVVFYWKFNSIKSRNKKTQRFCVFKIHILFSKHVMCVLTYQSNKAKDSRKHFVLCMYFNILISSGAPLLSFRDETKTKIRRPLLVSHDFEFGGETIWIAVDS